MTTHPLDDVQRLVDELSPLDQARLLEHLSFKIAQVIAVSQTQLPLLAPADYDRAWEAFFRSGDDLAVSDASEGTTLTQAVISMRR